MAMDDAADIGQADPGPFKVLRRMEALKQAEQFVHVLHVETDAVVPDKKDCFIRGVV